MAPPSRRQQEKSQVTRQELLAAAARVFARQGYAEATVDAITREAGYAKGSFYRHWSSKEEAFFALIDEGLRHQQNRVRAAWAGATSLPELVLAGFRAMAQETDDHWNALFAELWAHSARNPEIRERLAGVYARWLQLLHDTVADMQATGQLGARVQPEKVAALTVALWDGYSVQRLLRLQRLEVADLGAVLNKLLGLPEER